MCARCHSLEWETVVASGRGEIYSFVIHHHPPVYGFETPFAVALVELDEGTRIVGNVTDIAPADLRVGLPVEVNFVCVDNEWTLPQWQPRE
jgi:uncharacterized OB-fold protein